MSMKKRVCCIVFAVCCSFFSYALHMEQDSLRTDWNPSLNLKFSPLSLMDLTPTIQFAGELKAFERHSINLEYGRIFGTQSKMFNGNKFRLGYRFYFSGRRTNGTFIGVQVMNKNVNVQTNGFAWSPDRTFQKRYDFRLNNHTQALYITSGYVFKLSEKFTFEFQYGIGRRNLRLSVKDLPEGVEPDINLNTNFFNTARFGENRTPAVLVNIKFGYLIFGEH